MAGERSWDHITRPAGHLAHPTDRPPSPGQPPTPISSTFRCHIPSSSSKHSPLPSSTSHKTSIPSKGPTVPTLSLVASLPPVPTPGQDFFPNTLDSTPLKVATLVSSALKGFGLPSSTYFNPQSESTVDRNRLKVSNHSRCVSAAMKMSASASSRSPRRPVDYEKQSSTSSPPSLDATRRRHFVTVNASRRPTIYRDVTECPYDGDACGISRCSCHGDGAHQNEAIPAVNSLSADCEHEWCVTSPSVATSSTICDTSFSSPGEEVFAIQGSATSTDRLTDLSRILPTPDEGDVSPESPTCPPRHSRSRDMQNQSPNSSSNLPPVTKNIIRPYYCVTLKRDKQNSDSIVEEAESFNASNFGYPSIPFSSSFIPGSGSSPWRIGISMPLLLLCFVFTILAPAAVRADQVVLLDTTQESSLKWTRYPFGPNSPTPGWIEESFTRFEEGINWRSYVVCDVNYPSVNNWLWTPFIERGPANRMYVEIKFSMRDCSLFPGTALSCRETFSLLYYEFDAATKEPPFWESESYKLIDRIAADGGRFTNNNEVIINTEVRSIPVTKKGVYFALRDQGACISLLSIKVYYLTCPEITSSFAHFPTTPTGAEVTSIEQSTGTCVGHARSDRDPIYLCTGDGKWSLLSGGCVCLPGYQANAEKQTCDVCPPGQFKHQAGSLECSGCPEHSAAPHAGSTECRCDTGYYRATDDPKDMPCTRPPGKPRNLTATVVDQSTVELSWQPPHQHGGRHDTTYRIVCDACSSHVTFVPPQVAEESFNTTEVKVRGLSALSSYRFQVIAENGVSKQAPQQSSAGITVTTEAAGGFRVLPSDNKGPSMVRNVRITSVKSTEISLSWQPSLDPFSEIEMYEVRYYVKSQETNSSSILTTKEECTLGDLKQGTIYGFQVREKTMGGWGQYSPALYKMTGQMLGTAYVGEDDNTHVRIIVGATIGSFVLLGLVVAVVLLVLRSRGSDDCSKEQPSDCDTLEYGNGEVHGVLENPPIVQTHTAGSMTTPLFTPVGHHRTYIDPHTYEDPNQAIREFAREIDASYITIEAIIGGGEFGDVCKGKLTLPARPEMTVAIKTLKTGSSEKARVDFLTEASIMGQFEHPNVIFLQGVVTRSNPVMIITEYMENGSLDHFLRVNDGKFQVLQLVGMLRCIASGMQYLSEMNYVHRDLAARNVLVNAQLVCKIADFGLSREIESHTEAAYTTRGGKIPVRWTAPEAIAFRKFTSASDVWSLGIVMWEVMSYGERPYWNWSNQDVIKSIEKGYRLPAPMECPEAIYQLMLDCWQKERNHRPNFASIVHTLDSLIRTPEALAKVAQNRCQTALGLDSTDLTQLGSVEEWLASLKMSRYLENFEGAGLTEMQAVARLNQRDLTTLGIALVGHQKKILQSIQTLRTQYAVNMSEGFLV